MSIEISGLTKYYGATRAVDGISLTLSDEVQVLVLIGPSGGGKSTLLRLLGGLEIPTAGSITMNGTALPDTEEGLREFRRRNGFLFQSFNLFPHLSALENIVLPLVKVHEWSRNKAIERAGEVVARFGMADHVKKMPAELSGGQQQRIALARAMAHGPDLLLLDEPTSALDPEMINEVLDVMVELAQEGMTMMVVTHEMGFARKVADRVIFMDEGQIVEDAETDQFFGSPRSERAQTFLSKILNH